MKRLIILFAFFSLFVFSPLLNKLGYLGGDTGPVYFKILPSTYIIAFAFIFIMFSKAEMFWSIFYRKKYGFALLFLCGIIYMFIVFQNRTNSISFMADTLISSALLAIILPKYDYRLNQSIKKIILIFLTVDSLFAIFERLLTYNFFPPLYLHVLTDYYEEAFRSTALLGHPLNNALVIIIIMGFIYLTNIKYKNLYLLLGAIALLCFGSRGAIYGFLGLTALHYVVFKYIYPKSTFKTRLQGNSKFYNSIYIIVGCLLLTGLLFYTKFGDRLLTVSLFDEGSAGARIRILDILNYININEILWGVSTHKIEISMSKVDLGIIENFWLQWILRFGLVFTILLSISIISLLYNRLFFLQTNEKIYLILLFFMVASTNNSLATSTCAISTFLLCAAAFNPFRYFIKSADLQMHSEFV